MIDHRHRHLLAGALALLVCAATASAQQRGGADPDLPVRSQPFQFNFLGPATGGRTAAVAGIPGDTTTWYVGSSSGGVWKSTDGGHRFTPISDAMPVQAIGALAVAPSNRNIIWAGTGEGWAIRDADIIGDGIYKSTDAGKTWVNMGLHETGRIGKVIISPKNPNIVFACALGRATAPQQERGVFRTTDGGKTWKRVLFVDENTGCSSLSMAEKNPNVMLAGMWQLIMHPWVEQSGGPSSGVWITRDGGDHWTRVQDPSFPTPPLGKVGVAIAPSNPNRMYALLETRNQGTVWRSDNGGKSWHNVSWMRTLIGRAGYYLGMAVNSGNPDEVVIANSSAWRSLDGGKTFKRERWGGDTHDIWMDPKDPDHFAISDDGGARLTTDHGKTVVSVGIPNGQVYHVAIDSQIPYWVYGNRQDDGTFRGPSDGPEAGQRGGGRFRPPPGAARASAGGERVGPGYRPPTHAWEHGLGGCESGFTLPDLSDPNIVWASCYGNKVSRYNSALKLAHDVSPWMISLDSPPTDTKYRCHWTAPLALDPFDSKTIYYGCQVIFKTSNAGQSWSVISPDLSTHDPSRIVSSGGIHGDNLGQFYGEVVFAIAPSDLQPGLIWAGTNDGQVWLTRDGGGNWTNVTHHIQGIPVWGTVRKIQPSHFDAATAYVAVDAHMMDDRKPYVFKTTDFGETWTNITGDLPATNPLDYVMAVTENPNRRGMLFVGTGHGFYYSTDDGGHWTHFNAGLPAAPVDWVVVSKRFHDVVVSTYGRGIFVLRDVTLMEQPGQGTRTTQTTMFAPHPGYRQARSGRADFTFALPSAEHVQLAVIDPNGATVRTIRVVAHAGINRVSWDLHYDNATQVALRTLAPDNPHIWDEPRFAGMDTRPIIHWGIGQTLVASPIAAPGHYTVRLTAGNQHYDQPFDILKDPNVPSSTADIAASTAMQVRIRDDMSAAADMINHLEVMRKQLEDDAKAKAGDAAALARIHEMDKKLMDVELRLLSRSTMESDDKWFSEAYKVYLNLVWLYGAVGLGASDVAGGAEYRPTLTQIQVLQLIEKELDAAKAAYQSVMKNDVTAFNATMSGQLGALAEQ